MILTSVAGCGSDGSETIDGDGAASGSGGAAAGAGGAAPAACGCVSGDGQYCGARALADAAAAGCVPSGIELDEDALYACHEGAWSHVETCGGAGCDWDPGEAELGDRCALPDCECFVQVAWCGSGAAKKADDMGCRIPLLPEHDGDILYCPGGAWDVKQTCDKGCVEAAEGTPDSCKTQSAYVLPFDCESTTTCTNGNHTGTHTGKDAYAFDFGVPVGTTVRAMRGGTVLAVRYVSKPGSPCYGGGGTSCANLANTVEVLHSDGTVALYMHLSTPSVSKGDALEQGDVIGKSGNSGWSTGPHLHVQVQHDCGIWWCQSVPLSFVEAAKPSKGQSVTSDNCPR